MTKPLATFPRNSVGSIEAVLTGLKIGPRDTFKITGSSNILSVHVKKPNGAVRSAKLKAEGSFQQLTSFDPTILTIKERRKLTKKLYRQGVSQTEIGNMLGISQATVSLDLKRK
jgi:DNA-binding NarL/FixJ family response regulator